MQCMYIKLINDENLIAMVEDTGNDWLDQKSIDMTNPVQVVSTVHAADGNNIVETFTMEQWVKFVQQATVRLPVRSILTMMSVDEKTKKHYDDFLIKLSEKADSYPDMPDNVSIEEYNELMKTTSEDEDYDNYSNNDPTRYYH